MTIPATGGLEIKHEVSRARIEEAGLVSGERYRVSLTNKGLGTRWWAFGSLDEFEGVQFRRWKEDQENEAEDDVDEEEGKQSSTYDQNRYVIGENPDEFAFVIEKGDAEFEIV